MSKKNPSPLDNIKSELNKRPSTILDKEKKLTIEAQSKQTICLYRDGKEILARSFKPNFWTASAGALDGFSQDMKLLGIYNTKAEGRAALLCVTSELKNTFSSWLASNDTKSEVALEKITTSFYERKGQLYEEIYSDGFAKFVTLRNGEIIIVDEIDGIKPILDEAVRQKAVLLPTEAKPYKDTKSLLQEIQTFIHKWVDVSPKYEVIASWYILFSWVYDVLHTTPYLRALGDTGSGKTRFLDTIGRLCYKATAISGAVTPAPIYRLLTKWHGTLLVDEADFQDSSYYSEVITIFNCGFQRGRPVIRCNKDNPDDVEFFDAFGPKVIATRQRFKDKALEGRCLTEIMDYTTREIPTDLTSEFFKVQENIRNKLLMFRLKSRAEIKPDNIVNLNLGDIEPRLKQGMAPLAALFCADEDMMVSFRTFLKECQKDLIFARSTSYEGMIVNVIREIMISKEKNGEEIVITSADIAHILKEEYNFKKTSSRSVGKILSSLKIATKSQRIGGKIKRMVILGSPQLKRVSKRYIIDYEDVTSVTFVTLPMGSCGKFNTPPLAPKNRGVKNLDGLSLVNVTNVTNVTKKTVEEFKKSYPKSFTKTDWFNINTTQPEKLLETLKYMKKQGVISEPRKDNFRWIKC